ncbi:MAG: 50S ribosomal protein L24 [Methanobrevibacter sp.]|jgi:large subunit ribosomal protein L24|nr:50S ribosomal protein L24 [Methanobrevibacter sp.]
MSKQPRKQRKALFNESLHNRKRRISVNLSKDLQDDYSRRSLPVKSGDTVEVVRGDYKGDKGKVQKVNYNNYSVIIEGVTKAKTDGTDTFFPVHPSNLVIVSVDMKDDFRIKIIDRKS